jgi:large repetitive protein
VFTYTVGAANSGQLTSYLSLDPNAVSLNGATIANGAGTTADLTAANGYIPPSALVIDTIAPAIVGVSFSPGSGDLGPGSPATVTLHFNEPVNVSGGTPTIALNNGGTATYTGGSGTAALVFTYTVGPANSGQLTSYLSLDPNAVRLNGATIQNGAGTSADLTAANGFIPPGDLIIDTIKPAVVGISFSPGSGDLGPGGTMTVTLHFNEAVNVSGGTPTIALNNGGTATYTGGSGTAALVFTYTVGPANGGQLTSYLSLAPNAVSLNGASISNGAGTGADLAAANGFIPPGDLIIDTIKPAIVGISFSPSSGDLGPGSTVTLTLNFNEAVTVSGGSPSIALNDGGTATYTSGSGTAALVFTYTVGPAGSGQNTSYLSFAANAVSFNGATIANGAGTTADLTMANSYVPPGDLIIDTVTPAIASVLENPSSGHLGPGATVTFTVNFNEAVTVAGGTPTIALNNGGAATYTSGSGTASLVFTYTVGPAGSGQNTSWLSLAPSNAVHLNGAAIKNGAGTSADLSGANGVVPGGDVVIDTTGSSGSAVVASAATASGTDPITAADTASVSSSSSASVPSSSTDAASVASGTKPGDPPVASVTMAQDPAAAAPTAYDQLLNSIASFDTTTRSASGSAPNLGALLGPNFSTGSNDAIWASDLIRLTQLMATERHSSSVPVPNPAQLLAIESPQFLTHPHA